MGKKRNIGRGILATPLKHLTFELSDSKNSTMVKAQTIISTKGKRKFPRPFVKSIRSLFNNKQEQNRTPPPPPPCHRVKTLQKQNKEKILEAARKESLLIYKGWTLESFAVRQKLLKSEGLKDAFQVLKDDKLSTQITIIRKCVNKIGVKIKTSHDKHRFK